MLEEEPEDELCCCEYARDGDGQTRHLLQCLCECDDLDRLADDWCNACLESCCSCCTCCDEEPRGGPPAPAKEMDAAARRQTLRRLLMTVDDRCRIPWFGGARRVNAGFVFAPALLKLSELCCCTFDWLPLNATCMLLIVGHLVWMHLLCLSLSWRNLYFVSWILFSLCGLYAEYWRVVLPTQTWQACAAMHALLAVVLMSFAGAVLLQPSAARRGVSTSSLTEDTPSPGRLYACKVCGVQVHRRDHHCVWINQCVGSHNHRSFVLFVASFALLCATFSRQMLACAADAAGDLSASSYVLRLLAETSMPREAVFAVYAAGGFIFLSALFASQLMNIRLGLTTHERKRLAKQAAGRRGALRRHCFDHGSALANYAAWLRGSDYDQPAGALA